MRGSQRWLGIGLALGVLAGWPSVAHAQAGASCAADEWAVASFGIDGFQCNCNIRMQAGDRPGRSYDFRAEPRVLSVRRGGPADGRLESGDVIVAVDGHLITTREGMRRFSDIEVGTPVTLTVRRGGRELEVVITPDQECERGLPPAPPKAPRAPAAVARPAPPAPPARTARPAPPAPPAPVTSSGRLGMSVSCTQCRVDIVAEGSAPVWGFTVPPTIDRVEPDGPAARAGLRADDVLTHIDGVPLTEDEGGRRFGAVAPGDTVRLRFRRGDQTGDATLVAGESLVRLAPRAAGAVSPRPPRRTAVNRFSGVIGDAFVEVSGGPIVVERTEDEIVIRSQDITVRITKGGGPGGPGDTRR